MKIEKKSFPYKAPFVIIGYIFEATDIVLVTLEDDGFEGRGEATGVYYSDETEDTMAAQLENVLGEVEAGITLDEAQSLLPSGGARNALDCALWDLKAKKSGKSI